MRREKDDQPAKLLPPWSAILFRTPDAHQSDVTFRFVQSCRASCSARRPFSVAVRNDARVQRGYNGVADHLFHSGVFVGPELPQYGFKALGIERLARLDVMISTYVPSKATLALDVLRKPILVHNFETGISSALINNRGMMRHASRLVDFIGP